MPDRYLGKLLIILGTLALFCLIEVWAVLHHWYWISIPVGFLSSPVMLTVMTKVLYGRWVDWTSVWTLYRDHRRKKW